MIVLLSDHDIEGQAQILFDAVVAAGWLELVAFRLLTLADIGMPVSSSDRAIWEACQERQIILLTGNRTMRGSDSLGAVLRTENSEQALPVLTISNPRRITDSDYLNRCVSTLVEIALDLDRYRGVGRVFIP